MRIIFLVAFLVTFGKIIPAIVDFIDRPKSIPQKKVASSPAQKIVTENTDETALKAYKKLVKAIERSDEQTARRYISTARWNEMEIEQDDPSAIHELDAQCSVESPLESHDLDERAVLTASGESTLLIIKMTKEEDQWKVFSIECHHEPPPDYKEQALGWLWEQSSMADDLNSKLVRNGLRDGEVSCFMAVKFGKVKAVRKCLATGWSVNAEDTDGQKAIDLVLEKIEFASPDNREVLKAFIEAGANINAPNDQGMTPLMLAGLHCNEEIAKDLIDAGADLDYKTSDGITASKLAENCPAVTKLLRANLAQKH